MDIGSIGGILFALACILGGQALEGGHAGSLVQATAAIIVVGLQFRNIAAHDCDVSMRMPTARAPHAGAEVAGSLRHPLESSSRGRISARRLPPIP